jgi:putative addiction module antidote
MVHRQGIEVLVDPRPTPTLASLERSYDVVKLKVTTVGSLAGIVLPKEVLARLKVAKGDSVFLTESPDGFRITPYDPDFEHQMGLARKVMSERRDVLRALAK